MNPWTNVWTKTSATVSVVKNSGWVDRQGIIPYLMFGITGMAESSILKLFDFDPGIQEKFLSMTLILITGSAVGLLFRVVWVNIIYFAGKIWNGKATQRDIDTVVSLCLIPEVIKLLYLVVIIVLNKGNLYGLHINSFLVVICLVFSIRILLIGLSRVQKFSYGFAVLNIFVPQLMLSIAYLFIRI